MYGPDSVTTSASPFPFDAGRFRSDPDAYHNAYQLGLAKIQARNVREQMANAARDLHRQVEATIDR